MDFDEIPDVYYELEEEVPRFLFSSRFALALLGFFGFVAMSTQKACMSVAMVCMINQTALAELEPHAADAANDTDPYELSTHCNQRSIELLKYMINQTEMEFLRDGDFVWSPTKQNVIYSTFYWGYLLSQIPSGFLATRFGGKRIFGFFLLTSSITTGLIPLGSQTHYFILIFLRFVGGVGAGAAFPAMAALWGKWAPPYERTKLACMSYAGALTGSIITFPLTTALCELGILGGWPAVFYVVGGGGVAWFIVWILFASESPTEHGRISQEEKQYIVVTLTPETNLHTTRNIAIPWINVVTSLPFIALIVANFTFEWGMYTLETSVPQFFHETLNLDLKYNSLFSVLPFLGMWFFALICGASSDRLIVRGVIKTSTTRKIMQGIGTVIPAGMLVASGFLACAHWKAAVAFLVTGFTFLGFQYGGFIVNHLDIAPQYAGILVGIANAIGTTASFIAPFIVDLITQENTREQWQTVFFIAASFLLFGMFCFLLCGSGEIQEWARPVVVPEYDEESVMIDTINGMTPDRYIKVPTVAAKPIKLVPQNKVQPRVHVQEVQPVQQLAGREKRAAEKQDSNASSGGKSTSSASRQPSSGRSKKGGRSQGNHAAAAAAAESSQASTSREDSASHDFSESITGSVTETPCSSTQSVASSPPPVKRGWSKWSKKSNKSAKSNKSSIKSNKSAKSNKSDKSNPKGKKKDFHGPSDQAPAATNSNSKPGAPPGGGAKEKEKGDPKRLSQVSGASEGSDLTIENWKFYDTLSESMV